jgi:glycosyltransferase involved in cell wall biosynthesis
VSGENAEAGGARVLAGTTVLQAVPAVQDDWLGYSALHVANALLRAGARALVAGGDGAFVGELQALGGEWIELDFTARAPMKRRRAVAALRDLIGTERIDLVHAHGVDAARTALAAIPRGTARLVTSYLGLPPAPSWRRRPQEAMARGNVVVALSAFGAELIAERHAIPIERVRVIPASVDTTWFDPDNVSPERAEALRRAWRIPPDHRVILTPGRLAATQGHLTLVDAVRILVTGGLRRTAFVIAGTAAEGDDFAAELDRRILAQGLRPVFRRVGYCSDMPGAYALANFVVLPIERPSLFSTIAAEAQAMGRPLLAGDLGAMPRMMRAPPRDFEGSRTGWLTRPHDPVDLARAIAAALALGPEARGAMSLRAREFAQTHFSRARITAATLAMYGALLDKPA